MYAHQFSLLDVQCKCLPKSAVPTLSLQCQPNSLCPKLLCLLNHTGMYSVLSYHEPRQWLMIGINQKFF